MTETTTATQVLCAHESPTILDSMRELVEGAGYDVLATDDGDEALERLRAVPPPALLVVDVALPGRAGFELIDEIRRLNLGTRTILIASVYNQTGYKRRPTSLYGADDYIEQHHIGDELIPKIEALLPRRAAPRRTRPPGLEEETAKIRAASLERFQFTPGGDDEGEFRARRLAWLIVADILLYNGDGIGEWAKTGLLPDRARKDLDEGRALFALRVPEEVRQGRDFIGEALEHFLRDRKGKESPRG